MDLRSRLIQDLIAVSTDVDQARSQAYGLGLKSSSRCFAERLAGMSIGELRSLIAGLHIAHIQLSNHVSSVKTKNIIQEKY